MFTGIIQETGQIKLVSKSKKGSRFSVKTKTILKGKKIGQSIAIDGVCTTIEKIGGKNFEFTAIPETLSKSNLGQNKLVNLESPLKFGQEIDGHLIQGHVDQTATIESFKDNRLTIKLPKNLSPFITLKGSITINGVSLTISRKSSKNFSVDLIPETLSQTNLSKISKGDKVNIEIDLIVRYLKSILDANK